MAFLIGVLFLTAILILVVRVPTPTETQYAIFRIITALGGAAFAIALTGFLTVRMQLTRKIEIMAGGALGIFAILYFFSPAIPGVPKPVPLVDSQGHMLESPANDAELEVIRLQDQIMALREYKESVQQPDSRRMLKDAPYLAERILSFSDTSLNPRRRFIKYEFAAFAYVDAAASASFDDPQLVKEFAPLAIKNADTALTILDNASRTYQSDKNSRFLLDWIPEHEGKDRVLYLRADAECLLGTVNKDAAMQAQALRTWSQINSAYRRNLPSEGTPQLSPCVASMKSN
jgi:hypothetical protein